MADKPSKVYYQDVWTNITYESEEEAHKAGAGPLQPFIKHYDRYPKKGFFGTVVWRKKR